MSINKAWYGEFEDLHFWMSVESKNIASCVQCPFRNPN